MPHHAYKSALPLSSFMRRRDTCCCLTKSNSLPAKIAGSGLGLRFKQAGKEGFQLPETSNLLLPDKLWHWLGLLCSSQELFSNLYPCHTFYLMTSSRLLPEGVQMIGLPFKRDKCSCTSTFSKGILPHVGSKELFQ